MSNAGHASVTADLNLKNCSQWEAHIRSDREGWHPVRGTPCASGEDRKDEGAADEEAGSFHGDPYGNLIS